LSGGSAADVQRRSLFVYAKSGEIGSLISLSLMPSNRFNAHTDYGIGIGLRTLLEWDDRIPSFEEVHAEALEAEKYLHAPAIVTL
jgi:hypothetical protein